MTIHPKLSFLLPATLASVFAFGPVAFGQGASAQSSGMDITGAWFDVIFQDAGRTASGMLDEYPGIPINGPGRIYALTWDPSRLTIRQQQCSAYTPEFLLYGGGNFRFWEDRDPFTQRLISI